MNYIPREKILKNCIICNKEFYSVNNDKNKYCSPKCNDRAYYLRNLKKIRNRRKQNYIKEISKESYRENKSKYFKDYYQNNKGRYKKYMSNYYLKKKENWDIRNKDNHFRYSINEDSCAICNSKDNLEMHHTSYKNHKVAFLCRKCHRAIHRKYNPLKVTIQKGKIYKVQSSIKNKNSNKMTKQNKYQQKILESLEHYKDEPISTTELQYITGINYYGLKIALEELEVQNKIERSVKGISSYWRLLGKTKGESVK
jgi:hypothetical protein